MEQQNIYLFKTYRLSIILLSIWLAACGSDSGGDPPINSEPSFISGTTASVTENNTSVMNVTASDAEGDALVYSLTGLTDDAQFNIDINTGVLSFKVAPDFEVPVDNGGDNTYNVQVTVSDGSLSTNQNLIIAVINIDEAPVVSSALTISPDENQTAVITVVARDPEGASVAYSLTGSIDDALFNIDPNTGVLSFKDAPDYELPVDSDTNNIYLIEATVSDGGLSISQSLTITVSNVNEAPFINSSANTTLDENLTNVITVMASDPEGTPVTYSLTGSIDDTLFNIESNSGILSFKVAPDFELPSDSDTNNIYFIKVTASDGALTTSQSITVNVNDVLELNTSSGGVKTLAFNWSAYSGANYYKLLVNPDGNSGFSQEGPNIVGTSVNVIVPVHLTDWINASYMLEAYDGGDTLITSSSAVPVTNLMLSSIGYFKSSNTDANHRFGVSATLSGDGNTLAVGAMFENSSTTGINSTPNNEAIRAGAVYVFRSDGSNWFEQAYIKASNTGADDRFGISIAISGDGNTLAVGSHGEDSSTTGVNSTPNESANIAGAAYVFRFNGSSWSEQAYIKASNAGSGDNFGDSIALSDDGNTLAVGAQLEDSSTTGINSTPDSLAFASGATYVFRFNGSSWSEQAYIKASNASTQDHFGHSVALSSDGNTLAVGAGHEDSSTVGINSIPNELATDAGAVYVYRFISSNWTEQAYIKASDPGGDDIGNNLLGDRFGDSVALSSNGNTLAVGAVYEDSSTSGINSTPNEFTPFSGAAYLFRFAANNWSEQAYIKASNPGKFDNFGRTIDLSSDGNTLSVGSPGEDSLTTGINSTPNELASYAGAAYVFRFIDNNWSEDAYIKPTNTDTGDNFGGSVSLSGNGNTLAAGAVSEDSSTTGINSTPNELAEDLAGAVYVY